VRLLLVALNARHSQVCARQRETRSLVTSQREMRGAKFRDAVTLFATILIRLGDELSLVHVLMAGNALRLRNPKDGVFALGNVALLAFHFNMPAFEWIHARGMFLHTKGGGLEPIHCVTNRTICTSGARHELAAVIVGMAIHALGKCNRRLEIAFVVAVAAGHGAVLSDKRIGCLGMIEALKLCHLFPVRCVMARLAGAFEAPFVWIRVAISAAREGNACVLYVRLRISHGGVAFRAGHRRVRSRQRIFGGGVIELRSGLPSVSGVALCAVRAGLSSMLVLMAPDARARESQIGVI
jgi:hypothetical protein